MTASDQKPKESAEEFLSRWSRRKQEIRAEARAEAQLPHPAQPDVAAGAAPELPPVDKLDMDSDYRGFFHPKVDEALRRTALKKLFSDPHFNVMDGLDVYIDDYSISDPLPAAMLGELKQAQNILAWARETEEEAELRRNPPPPEQQIAADAMEAADPSAGPTAGITTTANDAPDQPVPEDGNKNT